MTEQEKQWFDALTSQRSKGADLLEEDFMRGVKDTVVNKYSDQAHFIYELLQNADDVKATTAIFRLEEDGLYFTHNGSVLFSISDPQNEREDKNNGKLGHVNSIVSIGNSNKKGNSIGKFGVGFKAVFQYTQTPHIYDPKIRFKIERFIVPRLLDADIDWREAPETVFWFPFDHKVKAPEESFEDVLEKLKALDLPILFLSHLKSVAFEGNGISGKYTKKVKDQRQQGDIAVQRLALTLDLNGKMTTQNLLTFARKGGNGLPYCVGYALRKDGKLDPIDRPAFCYFPTKVVTNLNFILHAPFLLTDSREGIIAGETHNQELVQQLAQLAADSLLTLRENGLISDDFLDVVPWEEVNNNGFFAPFYDTFQSKLQTEELLPSTGKLFAEQNNAYWASVPRIAQLISNEQLALLTGNKDARWVFTSFGRAECLRTKKALADYIDTITHTCWAFAEIGQEKRKC